MSICIQLLHIGRYEGIYCGKQHIHFFQKKIMIYFFPFKQMHSKCIPIALVERFLTHGQMLKISPKHQSRECAVCMIFCFIN